ncbi:MAG: sporulation protein [Candidatus Zixiibacteriota bacterium]|nr:MAG: sporulation protein [candidate division Zixibacteria bacterium]
MANNVVEILQGVVGELKDMARSESIVGEPITVGDKTVIPVVKISVGFGAGGGQGEDEKSRSGYGGGGGGGAKIEPAAFIIMDAEGIRLLPAKKGSWEGVIESIPGIAKKIAKWKDKLTSDKDEGRVGDEGAASDEPEPQSE